MPFGHVPACVVIPLVPSEEDDGRGYHDVRGYEAPPVERALERREALDEQYEDVEA